MTSVTWVFQYRSLPQREIVPQAVQPAAEIATGPAIFRVWQWRFAADWTVCTIKVQRHDCTHGPLHPRHVYHQAPFGAIILSARTQCIAFCRSAIIHDVSWRAKHRCKYTPGKRLSISGRSVFAVDTIGVLLRSLHSRALGLPEHLEPDLEGDCLDHAALGVYLITIIVQQRAALERWFASVQAVSGARQTGHRGG